MNNKICFKQFRQIHTYLRQYLITNDIVLDLYAMRKNFQFI